MISQFPITDFGASPAAPLNSTSIQAAIDSCHEAGGGVVWVPPGRFVTGSIQLRSRVTLELSPGAVLAGSGNLADYPPIGFHHNEFGQTRSLLWALDAEDLCLRGMGTIDFNHPSFMHMDQPDLRGPDGDKLHQLPPASLNEAVVLAKDRPNQPAFFHNCRRIRIENIRMQQATCWTITLSACDDAQVRGISVDNDLRVPNCDGINISASRNVIVSGCNFHCADDCVAVGSITDWDRPSENIVISGCTMVSRSAGVRLGHLASKVRNVVISDLVVSDGNRGIIVFAGQGGWVENVQARNLIFNLRMFPGFWWGKGEPLCICATHAEARIEGISIEQVHADAEGGIIVAGHQQNVREISLSNWSLKIRPGRYRPIMGGWVDLQPEDCSTLKEKHIPWLYQVGVEDLKIKDIRLDDEEAREQGYSTESVVI